MQTISCPSCQAALTCHPSLAGKTVRCPSCQGKVDMPSLGAPMATPGPAETRASDPFAGPAPNPASSQMSPNPSSYNQQNAGGLSPAAATASRGSAPSSAPAASFRDTPKRSKRSRSGMVDREVAQQVRSAAWGAALLIELLLGAYLGYAWIRHQFSSPPAVVQSMSRQEQMQATTATLEARAAWANALTTVVPLVVFVFVLSCSVDRLMVALQGD